MAHRLLQDPDEDGWERSDFPIVCETCLGPNPYIRMQRIEFGGTCNISGRPYTVFRWRPGRDARYKKTIICQEVAKAKNVCQVLQHQPSLPIPTPLQVCLLDLEYGLPVQVRDKLSGVEVEDIPNSDVNREYMLDLHASTGELGQRYKSLPKNDTLTALKRDVPNYKRNLSPVCTFFIRGECNRGEACPFRHEMPAESDLTEQNIRDRYYGVNDPVAEKLLQKAEKLPKAVPPEDPSATTIYVGGLPEDATEADLRDRLYVYGEMEAVRVVASKRCGFVTFAKRQDAETAMEKIKKLNVKGVDCHVMWRRPQTDRSTKTGEEGVRMSEGIVYPSMDPSAMGSYMPAKRKGEGMGIERKKRKSLPKPKPPPGAPPPDAPTAQPSERNKSVT